jgi:hypothetical protein
MKNIKNYKSSPVKMVTKDGIEKIFISITDAAKYAQVNSWTMSIKMQVWGYFQDANGNKYYRLDEMKTKNKYETSSPKMIHKQAKYKKKQVKTKEVKEETIKEEPKKEVIKQQKIQSIIVETDDPVIKMINERIVKILKDAGVYEEIKKLSEAIAKLSK